MLKPSTINKPLRVFFLAVFSLISSLGILIGFLYWNFVFKPASKETKQVVYEITPQKTFKTIAKELEDANLVKNAQFFNIYAKIIGLRSKIKVGEYSLNSSMRPKEILNVLVSGISIFKPLTIPEGSNLFEIAEIFERMGLTTKEEFIRLCFDQEFIKSLLGYSVPSLEGYLYPETYQITKYMNLRDILKTQVKQFQNVFNDIMEKNKITYLKPNELLILASIIEKETGNPSERVLISSVFHNRLRIKMKLQTDPTILYGKSLSNKKLENNITKQDLLSDNNPYNTYRIPALPPGPISNPGRASLMAAIQPAQTNFLYFVSQNDGTSRFTENLREHNSNVEETQLNPKMREGKSWRDLKK
ncbi:MAG: endolytic transglycosylase MltG [Deltaproteobacteria bacterium]|nr:endolytic transglycosylase MltG [Deltaproteobacteria bacterium]